MTLTSGITCSFQRPSCLVVVALPIYADSFSLHELTQLLIDALLKLFRNGRLGRLFGLSSDVPRRNILHLLLSSFVNAHRNSFFLYRMEEVFLELIGKVSVPTSIASL